MGKYLLLYKLPVFCKDYIQVLLLFFGGEGDDFGVS